MRRTPMKKKAGRWMMLLLLQLLRRQQRGTLHMGRIKAATYYVKGVQAARRGVMGYLGLAMLKQLLGLGVLLLHIGLVVYLPWTVQEKGLLLLAMGGLYTVLAAIAFGILLSQRTWMKATRADEAVSRAVCNAPLLAGNDARERRENNL